MNTAQQSEDSSFVRLAARLCLIGAVIGVVSALVTGFVPPAVADDRYSYPYTPKGFVVAQLVFLLNHVLLLVGILGLSRSGAAGPGRLGRSGLRIAVAGMGLLSLCEIRALTLLNVGYPSPPTDFLDIFFGVASMMIGAGLVLAGVSVARAGRWTGWRRFTPLACGVAVFVIVMPAIFGPFLAGRLAIGTWMLLFVALALAMRAETTGVPRPGVGNAGLHMARRGRRKHVGAAVATAVAVLATLLVGGVASAGSVTYTVTCIADLEGDSCTTWNEALGAANEHPGHDLIRFNIPGPGPHTIDIQPGNNEVTDRLTIDGYTQPGSRMNTLAEGTNAVVPIRFKGRGDGVNTGHFTLKASNSEIHGVAFTDFTVGLLIFGHDNLIRGNVFGSVYRTEYDAAADKNYEGISIYRSYRNTIGGDQPKDRNLISGNGTGIRISGEGDREAQQNVVVNNLIGTNAAGDGAVGNHVGVEVVGSSWNSIGLPGAANRNVISGNDVGVHVSGLANTLGTATENRVRNNYIGTDASGRVAVPNSSGISSAGAGSSANRFGGPTADDANLVSANSGEGIYLSEGSHTVEGNVVGLSAAGSPLPNGGAGIAVIDAFSATVGGRTATAGAAPGNTIYGGPLGAVTINRGGRVEVQGNRITGDGDGVWIESSAMNLVGGTDSEDANLIHQNKGDGVQVVGSSFENKVLGNSMFDNLGLGIDLGNDGVTANDPGDGDAGSNNLQNYPELSSASPTATGLRVDGSLNTTPDRDMVVEFFSQPASGQDELCWANSGHGQGRTYLGRAAVRTDAGGNAGFSTVVRAAAPGSWISATATGTETSEFSACLAVSPVADLWVRKTQPPGATAGSNFTYDVTVGSKGPSPAGEVVMDDELQPTTTFVSMTWPKSWSCVHPAPNSGGRISCKRSAPLSPGGAAEVFNIVGHVPSDTPDGALLIATAATVASPVSDPDMSNNRSSATFAVRTAADTGVVKTASSSSVARGGALGYTLSVTNPGPSDATTVHIEDPLDAQVSFVSLTSPPGWTCATPAPGSFGGTVACDIATLAAGAPAQMFRINVNVAGDAAGEILNRATVRSATADDHPSNNDSSVATVVSEEPSNPNGQGGVEATIQVAEDDSPPNDIRSVVVDPPAVAFGGCTRADGSPASGMTYPHGRCVTPDIVVTNTGAPSSIHVIGSEAVPSDAGPPWVLCFGSSCGAGSDRPGTDQYLGRTFAAGFPGQQFLAATARCDYAFATTVATSPSCWATSGQSQTERVEIVGPQVSSSAAKTFSTTLTWIAVP